jgi:hypothetical protein
MSEIEIDGVIRDLSHLQNLLISVKGKGEDGADLRVNISFSNHTVSKSCSMGQHDMLDENGKPRQFCEDRYACSLGLPEFAKRMIEQNYFCWESPDRNRNINFAVIDVAPGRVRHLPDGDHQVIFFYLYPSAASDVDVNLVITSCHNRPMVLSRIKRRFNVHTILRTCLFKQRRFP